MTDDILRAAFLPFGEVTDVNLPLDTSSRARLPARTAGESATQTWQRWQSHRAPAHAPRLAAAEKHRGFAFVQFEDRHDAADAIDNMNNAELFGRVLRVNVAKPSAAVGGHRPVWESHADSYYREKKDGDEGADADAEE